MSEDREPLAREAERRKKARRRRRGPYRKSFSLRPVRS